MRCGTSGCSARQQASFTTGVVKRGMSILSFPTRGQGGDARYPGNCSPLVYRWLIEQSRARSLLDPCIGGGTSMDVALQMGLQASGSDLSTSEYHQRLKTRLEQLGAKIELGIDATTAPLAQLFGQHQLVVAHPAYGTQKKYGAGKGDMSEMGDDEDFLQGLEGMLHGMREATSEGGHYVCIIGDTRRKGAYYSYQAAALEAMPRSELRAVRIKAQHNVSSGGTSYGNLPFGLLTHEYILIWQRQGQTYAFVSEVMKQQRERQRGTWKTLVLRALTRLGGEASLSELYREVLQQAPERVSLNEHYQAKVRQTVQQLDNVFSPARGVWKLAN